MNVRIQVRTDIDWRAMTRQSFADQSDRDRPLLFIKYAASKDVFGLWDRAFDLDYFELRHRLAAIARDNHSCVRGADRVDGLADFDAWLADPADQWVMPVDDDDLFAPDVAERVSAVGDSAEVVVWPELNYYWPGDEDHGPYRAHGGRAHEVGLPMIARTPQRVLWTNNWAVRKSFLRNHFSAKHARQLLTDHRFAARQTARVAGCPVPADDDKWYEFDLAGDPIRVLPGYHSMTVTHPASLFFLWNILQAPDPLRELDDRRFGAPAPIPDDAAWADPWVRSLERLLSSARRRVVAIDGHTARKGG